MSYAIANDLNRPSRSFQLFGLKISVTYFSDAGDQMKVDIAEYLEWSFKVISGIINYFIVCLKNTAYTVNEVNYNALTCVNY